jgi:DNA-directed RNA polymerase subunit omega
MQKQVEVDEPEVSEAPLMLTAGDLDSIEPVVAPDKTEMDYDRMTEEDLLRGLEGLPPAESPGSQRSGY